jgi:hypothetical protein
MEYLHLVDQTMDVLKPLAGAGGQIGTKLAANALWDWIKARVKGRSPAASEAVEVVEQSPGSPDNWEILRLQIRKALNEDAALRQELAELISKHAPPAPTVTQTAVVTGHGNLTIQNAARS